MKKIKYLIIYEIKTDYNKDKLEEAIGKLFGMPSLQYDDCDEFEYKKLYIEKRTKP